MDQSTRQPSDPSTPSAGQIAAYQQLITSALDVLVLTQHVDRAVYRALFPACRALRDWAVSAAQQAHLTLHVADGCRRGAAAWQRQLSAAGGALATRGTQHTTITINLYVEQANWEWPLSVEDAVGEELVEFVRQAGPFCSALTLLKDR